MKQQRQINLYAPQMSSFFADGRIYLGLLHTSWTVKDFRYMVAGTCDSATNDLSALDLKRYYNGTTVPIIHAEFATPSTTIQRIGYLERGAGEDAEDYDPVFASGSDKQLWAYWDHYILLSAAVAAGTITASVTVHLTLERTL